MVNVVGSAFAARRSITKIFSVVVTKYICSIFCQLFQFGPMFHDKHGFDNLAPQAVTLGCWLAFVLVLFRTLLSRKPKLRILAFVLILFWMSAGCGVQATEVCNGYSCVIRNKSIYRGFMFLRGYKQRVLYS